MILGLETKICRKCGVEKFVEEFYSDNRNKDGLYSYCKPCSNEIVNDRRSNLSEDQKQNRRQTDKAHYEKNRVKIRERQVWQRLKDRYGVTKEQYEQMVADQNGVCGICEKPCKTDQRLAVDHCHKTGKVRGLLCKSCNMSLGVVEKDGWLAKAFKYLGQDQ